MPVRYTDVDGNEIKGGTTHVTGGCCMLTIAFIVFAIVGFLNVLTGLVRFFFG